MMTKRLAFWMMGLAFALAACSGDDVTPDTPEEPEIPVTPVDPDPPFVPEKMDAVEFAAFPGAEGHGRETTGGRGGKVYIVTSLEDTNTQGTLRYAIESMGTTARTVVFQVSGTIWLKKDLKIANGNLTIAGQTAPGDGICLAGYPVDVSADNVIIRFLRFRMGDKLVTSDGADAVGGRFHKNIIIDHCSMSWCMDECVSFYNNENFTLQWCVISESLRLSKHSKGPHGYGGIWGGMKASFHHNLLAHHDSRNPRFGPGANSTPTNEIVDYRNNVIYNWCGNSSYGAEAMHINIVNNYYKPGPATPTGTSKRGRIISIDKKTDNSFPVINDMWGTFYITGNMVNDGGIVDAKNTTYCTNATNDNWANGVYNQFASGYGTISEADKAAMKRSTPVETNTVTTHTAAVALERVLAYGGCSLSRDDVDKRIVSETKNGTAAFIGLSTYNGKGTVDGVDWKSTAYPKQGIIDSQDDLKPAGAAADWSAWPTLKQSEVPVDTDKDGIPDAWEKRFGLNPNEATDGAAKTIDPDGKYTNLEMYLHYLVKDIITAKNKQ